MKASVQVYATEDVVDTSSAFHCPRLEMASRSKLSCVCWNSYIKHLLLAADYDGCLSLWDAQSNVCTGNFDDHGKRVWSADFSTVSARGIMEKLMLEFYAISCIQGGGGLEPSFLWSRCSDIYRSASAVPKSSLVHFSVGLHSLL